MEPVDSFPHPGREIENAWIPMPDGVNLAARLWLPEDAETRPVPAILEYTPYRRRVFTREHDTGLHRYFAGHGYACLRVDLRGSGDSEGVLEDERTTIERDCFRGDDFDSVRGEVLNTWSLKRSDWAVRTVTRTLLTSTAARFRIHAELDASHDELRIYSETWNRSVPRNHV